MEALISLYAILYAKSCGVEDPLPLVANLLDKYKGWVLDFHLTKALIRDIEAEATK